MCTYQRGLLIAWEGGQRGAVCTPLRLHGHPRLLARAFCGKFEVTVTEIFKTVRLYNHKLVLFDEQWEMKSYFMNEFALVYIGMQTFLCV